MTKLINFITTYEDPKEGIFEEVAFLITLIAMLLLIAAIVIVGIKLYQLGWRL